MRALAAHDYIADRALATAVYLALKRHKPLLLEGEPGVGKTEVARVLAGVLGTRLIRLQCYEGIDQATAVYEWNYARQLLYIRMLEADHRSPAGATSRAPTPMGEGAPENLSPGPSPTRGGGQDRGGKDRGAEKGRSRGADGVRD